jgi:hypothetical protein
LAALERAPAEAHAYARAAVAYASTDVPVMTLLWGMTYAALGGGAEGDAVASAVAKVLTERVVVTVDAESGRAVYDVRLAPGQMPLSEGSGGVAEAPLAHVFEAMFGATLSGFRPPWSVEAFHDAISIWVGQASIQSTPLDRVLPLQAWLVQVARAGHLEAFCYRVLGAAYPSELRAYVSRNPRALRSLDDYLRDSPLVIARAATPDLLVPLE